jgi:hypothetical protein
MALLHLTTLDYEIYIEYNTVKSEAFLSLMNGKTAYASTENYTGIGCPGVVECAIIREIPKDKHMPRHLLWNIAMLHIAQTLNSLASPHFYPRSSGTPRCPWVCPGTNGY